MRVETNGGNRMELYLHIPFCAKKCAYCDFLSSPESADVRGRYVTKLAEEIEAAGARFRESTVSTVFVGGGTPSILEPGEILRLFSALREAFALMPEAEISLEANPGTVTGEKLAAYREAGINRLSFGLQSADDRELRLLGRIHTWEEFLKSYRLARAGGFQNINVDLMSALPGQTAESWRRTLVQVTRLQPEHISAYSLIIEEGTPFYERYGEHGPDRGRIPDEETDREMYHLTKSLLEEGGYRRYEISNYARPGRECRHNIGYWTGIPYLGLGLGASSYVGGARFSGETDPDRYLRTDFSAVYGAGIPGAEGHEEERAQRAQEEFFFLGLRLTQGVFLAEFEERFGVPAETVYPGLFERLVSEGAAVFRDGRFCLTEYGLDVSNVVMAEFLQDG